MNALIGLILAMIWQPSQDITGTWDGIIESNGHHISITMEMTQNSSSITGRFIFGGSDINKTPFYMSGYVQNGRIQLIDVLDANVTLYFDGIITGDTIVGIWSWRTINGDSKSEPWIVHRRTGGLVKRLLMKSLNEKTWS